MGGTSFYYGNDLRLCKHVSTGIRNAESDLMWLFRQRILLDPVLWQWRFSFVGKCAYVVSHNVRDGWMWQVTCVCVVNCALKWSGRIRRDCFLFLKWQWVEKVLQWRPPIGKRNVECPPERPFHGRNATMPVFLMYSKYSMLVYSKYCVLCRN